MVAAHVDHVVGLGIFVVFQTSSLGYDVVNLLLGSLTRSVGRLLSRHFSVHRHCFNQSPLLFPPLRVCGPTLVRSTPYPGPNSALKSPPTICIHFSLEFVCFSIVLCSSVHLGQNSRGTTATSPHSIGATKIHQPSMTGALKCAVLGSGRSTQVCPRDWEDEDGGTRCREVTGGNLTCLPHSSCFFSSVDGVKKLCFLKYPYILKKWPCHITG